MNFRTLRAAINNANHTLKYFGSEVITESWQGIKKEVSMWEILNYSFTAPMPLRVLDMQAQCTPDLPWADDHFEERVSGKPLNPGSEYLNWPHYKNRDFNDKNFKADGQFTHTYMERYWPKYAGEAWENTQNIEKADEVYGNRLGIRYPWGDLQDLINLLAREPYTRQAYLPVWFPEDTGATHGGRVPCTLGYQFIMRDHKLHIKYYIRACDAIRHFRNDIYLTVRLAHWVLIKLQFSGSNQWREVTLGDITMDITSLHVFTKEKNLL
jgi:hypothetical protein